MDNQVLLPTSEAEISEILTNAKVPLRVIGGGTRPVGQVEADTALSTSALTGVTLYDPGALTLVAKSGTPLAEIERVVAAENQRLAFEPMDHRGLLGTLGTPTIGGVVAANISGPRRVQVGACRDHLLGARFIDGQGNIIKNGGRVMKNVTGYDLVKLMAGSHGTLGVLSEVSLKVLPQVEAVAIVMINGLTNEQAIAAMSRAMGSPYEVSGAAHLPDGLDGHAVTMLRIEGFEGSVAYRADAVRALFADQAGVQIETDPESVEAAWRRVRDVEDFHEKAGDVWRISCVPRDAARLAEIAGGHIIFDWAGGLVWALTPSGTDLRASLGTFEGHATLVRSGPEVSAIAAFPPEPPLLAEISNGLRQRFDPRGLLNPGLMG
ncbi:FAD-binding protein [Falsihalocynthiibacter sp. SS001]|uniref:FAD-binding protein n=1 Tax=Falsihalocynthiibacter sp. SS001 TaxID=3349698 RepID=UPI0036D42557